LPQARPAPADSKKAAAMSAREIIGFVKSHAEKLDGDPQISTERFDLAQQLEQAKAAEIARIIAAAERLSERFGPEVIVGFLFCEFLGRRPDPGDYPGHLERLWRSPASVPEIIGELLSLAEAVPPLPPA
jgi:hypothetical protein